MKDGDELVRLVKRRNQLELLWQLFSSPEYKAGTNYWIEYKIDGSEDTFCWN